MSILSRLLPNYRTRKDLKFSLKVVREGMAATDEAMKVWREQYGNASERVVRAEQETRVAREIVEELLEAIPRSELLMMLAGAEQGSHLAKVLAMYIGKDDMSVSGLDGERNWINWTLNVGKY